MQNYTDSSEIYQKAGSSARRGGNSKPQATPRPFVQRDACGLYKRDTHARRAGASGAPRLLLVTATGGEQARFLELLPQAWLVLVLRDEFFGVERDPKSRFVNLGALLREEIEVTAVGAVVRAKPNSLRRLDGVEGARQRQGSRRVHGDFHLRLDNLAPDRPGRGQIGRAHV